MLNLKSIEETPISDLEEGIIRSGRYPRGSEWQQRYNYLLDLYNTNRLNNAQAYILNPDFKKYYLMNNLQLITKLLKYLDDDVNYDFGSLLHYQLILILLAFEKGEFWLKLLGDELPVEALNTILKIVSLEDRDLILAHTEEKKKRILSYTELPFIDTIAFNIIQELDIEDLIYWYLVSQSYKNFLNSAHILEYLKKKYICESHPVTFEKFPYLIM